MMEALLGECRT